VCCIRICECVRACPQFFILRTSLINKHTRTHTHKHAQTHTRTETGASADMFEHTIHYSSFFHILVIPIVKAHPPSTRTQTKHPQRTHTNMPSTHTQRAKPGDYVCGVPYILVELLPTNSEHAQSRDTLTTTPIFDLSRFVCVCVIVCD